VPPRFFADIFLTPLEATRIRLVSDRTYASGLTTGFARLAREGGLREMYAGFLPIICKYALAQNHLYSCENSPQSGRQIPYAIGQFTVNELCHELVFRQLSEETKRNLGPSDRFGIALGSGITAGFAAAILSHVFLLIHRMLLRH
jgi:solute carrier family 25 (mitochondrial phosphate transporter), member 3